MPDITMCHGEREGETCPLRADCYRFTATPDKWRQSYFAQAPFRDGECTHHWPIEQEPRT